MDVPERRFVRFLIERRFVYRTASGNVLPYANVKNAGLFCVKDSATTVIPVPALVTPRASSTLPSCGR